MRMGGIRDGMSEKACSGLAAQLRPGNSNSEPRQPHRIRGSQINITIVSRHNPPFDCAGSAFDRPGKDMDNVDEHKILLM
jgi:hypothetical protein